MTIFFCYFRRCAYILHNAEFNLLFVVGAVNHLSFAYKPTSGTHHRLLTLLSCQFMDMELLNVCSLCTCKLHLGLRKTVFEVEIQEDVCLWLFEIDYNKL